MRNIYNAIFYLIHSKCNIYETIGYLIHSKYNTANHIFKTNKAIQYFCQELQREDMKWKTITRVAHRCGSPGAPSRKFPQCLDINL